MANRPNDTNPPAQPHNPDDRGRENRDTDPERVRGVADDSPDAMEDDEEFDESDDLEDEKDEGEGSF